MTTLFGSIINFALLLTGEYSVNILGVRIPITRGMFALKLVLYSICTHKNSKIIFKTNLQCRKEEDKDRGTLLHHVMSCHCVAVLLRQG